MKPVYGVPGLVSTYALSSYIAGEGDQFAAPDSSVDKTSSGVTCEDDSI